MCQRQRQDANQSCHNFATHSSENFTLSDFVVNVHFASLIVGVVYENHPLLVRLEDDFGQPVFLLADNAVCLD